MVPEYPQIVRSLAGHDKGELFCVLSADGPICCFAMANGAELSPPSGKRPCIRQTPGTFDTPYWTGSGRESPSQTERCGGRWPLSELRN